MFKLSKHNTRLLHDHPEFENKIFMIKTKHKFQMGWQSETYIVGVSNSQLLQLKRITSITKSVIINVMICG